MVFWSPWQAIPCIDAALDIYKVANGNGKIRMACHICFLFLGK